jgi:copper transport protein
LSLETARKLRARKEEGQIRKRLHRSGAAALVALAALVLAPTAFAHATLKASDPTSNAVVRTAPPAVLLQFSEPVETALGGVRVLDTSGKPVDSGDLSRPARNTVSVGLQPSLPKGTYTVTWRVVSADSHPVHGAFLFSVGKVTASALAPDALKGLNASRPVRFGYGVTRFASFVLLLLATGGAAVLVLIAGRLTPGLRRRLYTILAVAAALIVPFALAKIVFQGADAGGFGLGDAARWPVVSDVLGTRFGKVMVLQAAFGAALAAAAFAARRLDEPIVRLVVLLTACALAVTPTAVGHASVSGTTTTVADLAHVVAAAAWTGGLAFVVLALVYAGKEDRWPLAARIVPVFSRLAVGSVAVLLGAGIVNGYEEVKAWRGLWDTLYGQLLLVKVGLILPLLALGAYNNRYAVPRLRREIASPVEQRRFLRAASAEIGIFVAIVAVTAALVQQAPAKAQIAPTGPYSTTTQVGPYELDLTVDPARPGPNLMHFIFLTQLGAPAQELADADIKASLPDKGISSLPLKSEPAGPGHWVVTAGQFPFAGDWRLAVQIRRGEFDQWNATVPLPIRKD